MPYAVLEEEKQEEEEESLGMTTYKGWQATPTIQPPPCVDSTESYVTRTLVSEIMTTEDYRKSTSQSLQENSWHPGHQLYDVHFYWVSFPS
jgi:hypothetical protein